MKSWWVRVSLLVVVVVVPAGAGFYGYFEAMKHGWIRYNEYDTRAEGILQVGDPAPDLTLQKVGGESPITLSELYRVHPLVLVFGSYT